MSADLTTLYHPTLDETVEVAPASVADWVEQGWRKTAPKPAADKK